MFQVDKDRLISDRKLLLSGSDFVEDSLVRSAIFASARYPLTVGHVRHTTSGKTNQENAHPFKVIRSDGSTLIGVHNGTLVSSWRSRDNAEKYTVDSDWALNLIASEGLDAFEQIDGAYAFVWYDSNKPDSVFMVRNKERPLHYLHRKKDNTILGCSELGMLGWLADRNKLTPEDGRTFYLEPDFLYEFSLTEVGKYKTYALPSYVPLSVSSFPSSTQSSWMWPMHGRSSSYESYYSDGWDDSHISTAAIRQNSILEGVKDALRKARYSVYRKENPDPISYGDEEALVIDSDELERAMERALVKSGESVPWNESGPPVPSNVNHLPLKIDNISRGNLFLISPRASAVTGLEKDTAKSCKVFGMVVKFVGVDYDNELASCNGYCRLFENNKWVEYEGQVRYLQEQTAHDLYINPSPVKTGLAVVTGLCEDLESFILETLTAEELRQVQELIDSDIQAAAN